jgi:hypothetical protein
VCQCLKRVVKRNDVDPRFRPAIRPSSSVTHAAPRPRFCPCLALSQVNQDVTHQTCGQDRKCVAIPPVHAPQLHQPKISLIHQGCGLQDMSASLTRMWDSGDLPQFVMYERN